MVSVRGPGMAVRALEERVRHGWERHVEDHEDHEEHDQTAETAETAEPAEAAEAVEAAEAAEVADGGVVEEWARVAVVERGYPEVEEMASWSRAEKAWWSLGPFAGEVPGLVRRVRRILDVSQRGLAGLLGVSQSVVARWETGRTSPRASVLAQLLALAGVEARFAERESGAVVEPMRDDGARTRGGSRFPAHTDLRVAGWWIPRRLRTWTSAEAWAWQRRSRESGMVAIRYRTSVFWRHLERQVWGTPIDHPAHHQLVAEMRATDERRDQQRHQRPQAHHTRAA